MNKSIVPTQSEQLIKIESDATLEAITQHNRIEQKAKLPWIQILNPRDPIDQIYEENKPFGIFFAQTPANANEQSQTEVFGFVPEEPWQQITYRFNPDDPVKVQGFNTKRLRFVLLDRGVPSIWENLGEGFKYKGPAFNSDRTPTQDYVAYQKNNKNYKMRTRNLILPVNSKNQIMSSYNNLDNAHKLLPVVFSFSLGIGATLGNDLTWYYTHFDSLIKQSLGQVGNFAYSQAVRNTYVIYVEFDLRKLKGGSNFCCPKKFLMPTLNPSQIGKTETKIIQSKKKPDGSQPPDRQVLLEYVSINDLKIKNESDTGILIDYVYQKHVKPRVDEQTPAEKQKPVQDVVYESVYLENDNDGIPF